MMSQWKCALMMTVMVKPSAQIEPLQVSKGNEICFILFLNSLFCNCKVFFFLLQQSEIRLCWINRDSKDTNIMIGAGTRGLRSFIHSDIFK